MVYVRVCGEKETSLIHMGRKKKNRLPNCPQGGIGYAQATGWPIGARMDVDVQEKSELDLKKRGRPKKDRNALKRQLPETQQKLHNHPDPTLSRTVATMALAGFPQAEICKALKMSTDTLSQYYHDEFTHGKTKVMTEVVGSLAQRAIAGSDTAAIWLTKTRLGWSDRQQVDVNANLEVTVHRGSLVSELAGLIEKGITIDATPEPENLGQTENNP